MTVKPQARLWAALRQAGLTQAEFARLVGEHAPTVSRVITGVWNLSPAKQMKWAKALGRKPEELFGDERECAA
jgi:transcriptional regulator with XRE-family HTH domain